MATQVAFANGFSQQSSVPDVAVVKLAQQLSKLRNDVLAGTHPRLKAPKHLLNGVSPSASESVGKTTASSTPNGVNLQATVSNSFPASFATKNQALQASTLSNASAVNDAADAKATLQERRKRLERVLEEQIRQKRALSRLRPCDQEIIADFDVSEILRKAHERVKPFKPQEDKAANRAASSSDSFDDNTFYSSQMNSSTTTEEAESSKEMRRPLRACRFYRDGKPCPYGEKCQFSHDPSVARKPEVEDGKQRGGTANNRRTNEQASRRAVHSPLPPKASTARASAQNNAPQDPQTTRIAELEEQLRLMKEQQQKTKVSVVPRAIERDEGDDTAPIVDEFGRDRSRREVDVQYPRDPVRRPSPPNLRGSGAEVDDYSPSQNHVQVVRNHITSPRAPQPARVSPLAVTKLPQMTQFQRSQPQNEPLSRNSIPDPSGNGQAPNSVVISSKKRRRGADVQEHSRNVVQRREDVRSPVVRIKEEPVSPPPYRGISNYPLANQPSRYIDNAEVYPEERVVYRPQHVERPIHEYEVQDPRPITPSTRRVVSRNGHHVVANEEPDLRRVVSAKYMRAPPSPGSYSAQYSDPQSRVLRAASHVQHVSPTERSLPVQYRASVQPQAREAPQSPLPRQIPISPARRTSVAMPPPARRIVVDEFGNRYVEAPMSAERPMPAASRRQVELEPQYEPAQPRHTVLREQQPVYIDEQGRYVQRIDSPTSPQYAEYPSAPRKRRIIQLDQEDVEDGTLDDGSGMVRYEPQRQVPRYADLDGAREGTFRMQSVRPVENGYETMPRETIPRVSSVRPQQRRIVSLGEQHREMTSPRVVRQVSVRPDDGLARPVQRTQQEPMYQQYAPQEEEGRYVEAPQNERLYEQPASGTRRYVQRL